MLRSTVSACLLIGSSGQHSSTEHCQFDVVDGSTLTRETFEETIRQKQPVLIFGLTADWPAHKKWHSPQFAKEYGDILLPNSGVQARSGARKTLQEYVDLKEEDRYVAFDSLNFMNDMLPRLKEDFDVPDPLMKVFREPLFSLAGSVATSEKRGLSFHQHAESWLALITGEKEWFIREPGGKPPKAGRVHGSTGQFGVEALSKEPGAMRCTQRPGDIIYLPTNTWHATYNTKADSAGLTLGVGGWDDSTPLISASVMGKPELVKMFAAKAQEGLDEDDDSPMLAGNRLGEHPLHMTTSVEVMKVLVEGNADIFARTSGGRQPLYVAAERCSLPTMKWLVEQGALKDSDGSSKGMSLFHAAAECGSVDVLNFLAEKLEGKVDVKSLSALRSKRGITPLHIAVRKGPIAAAEWMVEHGAKLTDPSDDGNTLMHYATDNGRVDMLEWLVKNGGDVKAEVPAGHQPIHYAAQRGLTNAMEFLVAHGADVRAAANDESEPIHIAANEGHVAALQWLHAHGADISAETAAKQKPFDLAVASSSRDHITEEAEKWLRKQVMIDKKVDQKKKAGKDGKITPEELQAMLAEAGYDEEGAPLNEEDDPDLAEDAPLKSEEDEDDDDMPVKGEEL